ncbi:MAG: amidohydrolase family protein, partial [Planctomycetota bacterium]
MRATLPMFLSLPLAVPLALALPAAGDPVVAVQAGPIHLVQDGRVIEGGGTLLISGGKILAVGADVSIPAGAVVVDYGPEAVIIPGLVAADSRYASSIAAGRTASPSLRAIDQFDPYSNLYSALTGGVTSVYLAPARGRLVAGQGAVVKTGGGPQVDRVLTDSAAIHGSIAAEARRTPGYWVPPVPATVDVGLGVEQPQLPRTTMGAVVALEELLALIAGDDELAELYGPQTAADLGRLVDEGRPWRMGAASEEEVRALLEFFAEAKLPLVLDTRVSSVELAEDIARAGVPVIAAPHVRGTTDFGKTPDSDWPRLDGVSILVAAGVRVAVVPARIHRTADLRFASALAQRGGLDAAQALRSITLTPAEILGVADRVGSLAAGKDADLVVLNGAPLDMTASVLATWVGGEVLWKAHEAAATVIEVLELHLGDGHVLRPGQVLMEGGRITEVGARVAHPPGATVVRGSAAMPGMIDALGHLGLEGSRKAFSSRFDLKRLLEPGDYADRRVARGGVTTVNLGSRDSSGNSPTMAYKPAGSEVERMLIEAPAAMRMTWTSSIRSEAGDAVRSTLKKAAEYKQKWEEYEKAIAEWTPEAAKEKDEKSEEGEEGEEGDEEKEGKDEEKQDNKKKKKKKKKGEKEPARPVTGEWTGTVTHDEAPSPMRLRLREREWVIEGTLRVEGLDDLVFLAGNRDEYAVTLAGLSSLGWLEITLELDDQKLTGTGTVGSLEGLEAVIELTRSSEDYPVAQR